MCLAPTLPQKLTQKHFQPATNVLSSLKTNGWNLKINGWISPSFRGELLVLGSVRVCFFLNNLPHNWRGCPYDPVVFLNYFCCEEWLTVSFCFFFFKFVEWIDAPPDFLVVDTSGPCISGDLTAGGVGDGETSAVRWLHRAGRWTMWLVPFFLRRPRLNLTRIWSRAPGDSKWGKWLGCQVFEDHGFPKVCKICFSFHVWNVLGRSW